MKQEYLLFRPHHSLCLQFFVGKGYSDAFVENMVQLIGKLKNEPDTHVLLTRKADVFCTACPHWLSGECEASGKAAAYDEKCLKLCGFSEGQCLKWEEMFKIVKGKILMKPRTFYHICSDCMWFSICQQQYVEKLLKMWKT